MNEHIDKLIEQACAWVAENYPESLDDNDQFHALSMERLAELIVRECALQCRHNDDMDRIEKHFGVEE